MTAQQIWHWLIQGLQGLVGMMEGQAKDCELTERDRARIEEYIERLKKLTQKE